MGSRASAAGALRDRCVLVTRPRGQAQHLADLLAEHGAEVVFQPTIQIGPPQDWAPVDAAIDDLGTFDWIMFSSANGVDHFCQRVIHRDRSPRETLDSVAVATIGPGTANALGRYRVESDRMPAVHRAEQLAACLEADAAGRRFLLVRASRGREVLAERLRRAGGDVTQVVAYRSEDITAPQAEVALAMEQGRIDWTTVTSSAIGRALARLFGPSLQKTRLASISPITTETLRKEGLNAEVEAQQYTMAGLVQAIVESKSLRNPSCNGEDEASERR